MRRFEEILCFWFGGLEEKDFAEPRKSWFAAESGFDAEIRRLFLDDYERAARGEFDSWRDAAQSFPIATRSSAANRRRRNWNFYATPVSAKPAGNEAKRHAFAIGSS